MFVKKIFFLTIFVASVYAGNSSITCYVTPYDALFSNKLLYKDKTFRQKIIEVSKVGDKTVFKDTQGGYVNTTLRSATSEVIDIKYIKTTPNPQWSHDVKGDTRLYKFPIFKTVIHFDPDNNKSLSCNNFNNINREERAFLGEESTKLGGGYIDEDKDKLIDKIFSIVQEANKYGKTVWVKKENL